MTSGVHQVDEFPVRWQRPDDERWLWSHDLLHYPDQVTPLEFSLIEDGVNAGITRAARAYDIPITVHDRHINGYLYSAIETHEPSDAEASRSGHEPSLALQRAMADLRTLWDTAWLPEIKQHLDWWARFQPEDATAPVLALHLAESVLHWQRVWEVHFLLLVPSMFAMSEFADLYADLFDDHDPFVAYKLLGGFASKTLESSQQLWSLSRRVLASPTVTQVLLEHSAPDVVLLLRERAEGRLFLAELDEYLAVHGRRADKLSLHDRYWVEDPSPVINSLRNYLQQPDRDLRNEMRQVSEGRRAGVARLRAQMQDFPRPVRNHVESLLAAAQAGAFLAEEHGYWIDYDASFRMRQVLLAIGARLVATVGLEEEEDLFYLRLDEVQELLASEDAATLFNARYCQQVALRKAQAAPFADIAPPRTLGTHPGPTSPEDSGDPITHMFRKIEGDGPTLVATSDSIVGNAGSPGVVRGTVKVVHGLGEAGKVEPGDILVAETTAPPWTALFGSLGGLVTNSGGILSHSAVIAREYGIPAVVGARMATQLLHDGQLVEVDGSRGIVRILE